MTQRANHARFIGLVVAIVVLIVALLVKRLR